MLVALQLYVVYKALQVWSAFFYPCN